jgi:hypothetical protein
MSACAEGTDYKIVFKEIKEENKKLKYSVSAYYPVLSGFQDQSVQEKFNAYTFQLVLDEVNSFKKDMQDWEAPKDFSSEFEIADSLWYRSDEIISIRFDGYEYYAGAAHPLTFFFSATYNLKKNRVVKLDDLFTGNYLKSISDYCIKELIRQKNEYTNDPDISWIQEGASPKDSNYTVFNITGNSFLITFPVYQVASYAEGPKEVYIPYSILRDIIKPDGPLSVIAGK